MQEHRAISRQPITVQRSCVLGIISFKQLEWTDHVVQIVDISRDGVGVESEKNMEPGFVWFCDRIGGHKGGVLVWTKKKGSRCRAGIRFVTLNDEDERSLQQSSPCRGTHHPRRSPEQIVSALMKSMTGDDH